MESKPDFSTEELWGQSMQDIQDEDPSFDGFEKLPKQTARRDILRSADLPGIVDGKRVNRSDAEAPHKAIRRLEKLEAENAKKQKTEL